MQFFQCVHKKSSLVKKFSMCAAFFLAFPFHAHGSSFSRDCGLQTSRKGLVWGLGTESFPFEPMNFGNAVQKSAPSDESIAPGGKTKAPDKFVRGTNIYNGAFLDAGKAYERYQLFVTFELLGANAFGIFELAEPTDQSLGQFFKAASGAGGAFCAGPVGVSLAAAFAYQHMSLLSATLSRMSPLVAVSFFYSPKADFLGLQSFFELQVDVSPPLGRYHFTRSKSKPDFKPVDENEVGI